jgi:molybdopterin converting factor small subunit
MKIHVQFFSRLRDLVGTAEMEMDLPDKTNVADLLQTLYRQTPKLREWDQSILVASGVEFVARDYVLKPHDQISIMPPVQGG